MRSPSPFAFAFVAAAAFTALATLPATAAFTSSVTGTGYTSTDDGVNRTPIDLTSTTDPLTGKKSIAGTGFSQRVNALYGIISHGGVVGEASVGPGQLKSQIHGLAYIGAGAPNVPTNTHGTPRASGNFGATFADQVTLGGNLPVGTPVKYLATVRFNVDSNLPRHSGPQFSGYDTGSLAFTYYVGFNVGANYFFPNGLFTFVPDFGFEQPVEVTGLAGDVVPLGASLGTGADDRAGLDAFGSSYGGLTETIIDASHTAEIFLDPITPGLTLLADSGHNYSFVPVPEPLTTTILFPATLLLTSRRRPR